MKRMLVGIALAGALCIAATVFGLTWLVLVLGTLLFKGRCTALNIAYKLFNPDGAPIRAICKVTFKEMKEEKLRVAQEHRQIGHCVGKRS